MAHKKKKIQRRQMDRISDLPSNLIENILICLPLQDAMRTSILSRKWRYNWVKLPKLVFNDAWCQCSAENKLSVEKILLTIYQVLLLHHGPVLQFMLSIPKLGSSPEIDRLILFLSRNGIEELTLHIWEDDCYKLPCSFFTCLRLRHLSLSHCHLSNPPPTFNGFGGLVTLKLIDCFFDECLFGSLVSSCPLLESLTLQSFTTLDNLEIEAPNLNFLYIKADFKCIRFKNTPLLVNVSVWNVSDCFEYFEVGNTPDMAEVFGCLPLIEKLHLRYGFIKFLSLHDIPERLFCTLDYLKVIELVELCFVKMDEVAFALCLIRSSPNLEKIRIEVFLYKLEVTDQTTTTKYLEDEFYSDLTLNQLRVVHIKSFSGSMPEMNFIKLLLAKSSMLETVQIETYEEPAAVIRMLTALTRFHRASPKAEIIFKH